MKKFFSNEVKIAITAILALVLLFFGLRYLKGLSLFGTDKCYYVRTNNVSGLATACPVYANGFKVGTVHDIIFNYQNGDEIIVALNLDRKFNLPEGSFAAVVPSLMGGTTVELTLGKSKKICQPGDTIFGGVDGGILSKAADLMPSIQSMMPKLDSILGRINTLLGDTAVDMTLDNVEYISAQLRTTTSQLNTMMATINRDLPGLMTDAKSSLKNVSNITTNVDKMTSNLDLEKTVADINATLANVKTVTDKLSSDKGTLGAFMNDRSLYNNLNTSMENLNTTIKSADSLVTDLKAHPKRYVHFSIFGKKDK
ncbi:MAG: MlaD family protein [Prevotellaceae bacterium]|nr:MlaD family protein [Prevotellaceae bacterium]